MKYTLALIALLGLTENTGAVMISKHHGHKHHKHHQSENVQVRDEDAEVKEEKAVVKLELTEEEKKAAELVVKREELAKVKSENFQTTWENSENFMKKQVKDSVSSTQQAIKETKYMEKLLVGKVEKQQAAWEKPKNAAANAIADAEVLPEAPKKQVIGNGGEWTLNMPASIINGGSGANHWAAKQAKLDTAAGAEAEVKAGQAEAKAEVTKEKDEAAKEKDETKEKENKEKTPETDKKMAEAA